MIFSCHAVVAEWQTRCLQAAVIFGRAGLSPANRTMYFLMDETLIEAVKQWNIDASLPLQVGDFTLIFSFEPDGKGEETIFAYKNEKKGWTVRALYNDGSGDFSVRVDIGMLEFSLIEFITDDFDAFRSMTEERLPAIIESHYVHAEKDFNVIMKQKGVPDGDWESLLPAKYAGFRRTVDPTCAVRIINGSYMVAAYYDGVTQSGLAVMYNFLRDDFFAERRVHNFPNLVHDFDSTSVDELRGALRERLCPVLDEIRDKAERKAL